MLSKASLFFILCIVRHVISLNQLYKNALENGIFTFYITISSQLVFVHILYIYKLSFIFLNNCNILLFFT